MACAGAGEQASELQRWVGYPEHAARGSGLSSDAEQKVDSGTVHEGDGAEVDLDAWLSVSRQCQGESFIQMVQGDVVHVTTSQHPYAPVRALQVDAKGDAPPATRSGGFRPGFSHAAPALVQGARALG